MSNQIIQYTMKQSEKQTHLLADGRGVSKRAPSLLGL